MAMKKLPVSFPRARLRSYLAVGYVLFIVYFSLSPFSGWRGQGLEFSAVLTMPLLQQYTWFDVAANLLAYLPFGLLFGQALRTHFATLWSVLFTTLGGAVLSAAMEYAQMYLPVRISSNLDLLINSCGALLGAVLAVSIASHKRFTLLLTHWRMRLLHGGGKMDFGLALVVLWMFAQINPSLPMLGTVFIGRMVRAPFVTFQPVPFSWVESLTIALNLLMLGLLLLTLLRNRNHVMSTLMLMLCLVALAKFIAAAMLLKFWALLLWLNGEAIFGMLTGLLLLAAAVRLPREWILRCAALVTLVYWVLINWILDSGAPSNAMPLYQWNYGHLLNYNDLSQSIAFLFPLIMLLYLWRIKNK